MWINNIPENWYIKCFLRVEQFKSNEEFKVSFIFSGTPCICSENIGADQLRGYREADLRLCFRICKKQVFS